MHGPRKGRCGGLGLAAPSHSPATHNVVPCLPPAARKVGPKLTTKKTKPHHDPEVDDAADPGEVPNETETAHPPAAPSSNRAVQFAPPPSRCRIIEYTDGEGRVSPAIVTETAVSLPMDDSAPGVMSMGVCAFDALFGPRNYRVDDVAAAMRAVPGEPGTWNWPVRQG